MKKNTRNSRNSSFRRKYSKNFTKKSIGGGKANKRRNRKYSKKSITKSIGGGKRLANKRRNRKYSKKSIRNQKGGNPFTSIEIDKSMDDLKMITPLEPKHSDTQEKVDGMTKTFFIGAKKPRFTFYIRKIISRINKGAGLVDAGNWEILHKNNIYILELYINEKGGEADAATQGLKSIQIRFDSKIKNEMTLKEYYQFLAQKINDRNQYLLGLAEEFNIDVPLKEKKERGIPQLPNFKKLDETLILHRKRISHDISDPDETAKRIERFKEKRAAKAKKSGDTLGQAQLRDKRTVTIYDCDRRQTVMFDDLGSAGLEEPVYDLAGNLVADPVYDLAGNVVSDTAGHVYELASNLGRDNRSNIFGVAKRGTVYEQIEELPGTPGIPPSRPSPANQGSPGTPPPPLSLPPSPASQPSPANQGSPGTSPPPLSPFKQNANNPNNSEV